MRDMTTTFDLITAAYAAAHKPLLWEDFLDALLDAGEFGAVAVGYRPDVHEPWINGFLRGPSEEAIEDFFARAIPDDPLAPLGKKTAPGPFLAHGNRIVAPEVFTSTGYHDWMQQNGLTDVLVAGERYEDGAMVLLTAFCSSNKDIDAQLALLEQLSPHACHAVLLCQEYVALTHQHRQALAAIEHARFGCAVIGERGHIEWMNERGHRLLEQANCVEEDLENDAKLTGALLATLVEDGNDGATSVKLDHPDATSSYEVRIVPLKAMEQPFGQQGRRALLFIADPEHLELEIDSHIQVVYGLTQAEARVARHIVLGYSVENIAAILSRSSNTIRVQLKSAMRKCQVSSQAQLVGLIHRGLALS